ncbi:ABC transporter ATP-binding protein [Aestuariibaculum sediminum]|uniref:ABC transporter ATP-binding protein n=1 Tax=Aestuariibaculum sediminum TaxID=2770637 RepID=A0A8J6Q215_9FLAO|nr:ABC transporter ATP-binding protein [Aestuariibaculum sediminum]MBD0831529.1 ABC transporter ATP-binding protein [Aestuariibaculum sediminum]
MKTSIIELKGLTKRYGSIHVVNHLNLNIHKGEIFGLLGPNGAGKTTTILMMLGLIEPTSGIAKVCGHNSISNPIAVKSKVGYMPDNVGFYDHMTGLENLIYIGELNGLSSKESEKEALKLMQVVGLDKYLNSKTATYSRGMKQRLGLADVLIKQPEVIIMDEPTLGIDPSGVKDFLKLIKTLSRKHGLTVLLSSHHLNQVQKICDRVGIFVKGKLLAQGNIEQLSEQLFSQTSHQISITLDEPVKLTQEEELKLLQLAKVEHIHKEGNQILISCNKILTPNIVRFMVEQNYNITSVHQKTYGLEDIYQKYFENQHLNV